MTAQRPPTKQATVTELYNIIGQLIEAYDNVMLTFGSVVSDQVTMQNDIDELERFVNNMLADTVQASGLWQANAKIHKQTANELRVQLQILTDKGCKIEVDIPLLAAALEAVEEAQEEK